MVSGGRNPLSYLASQQATDGHYRYSSATDQTPIWVTAQALLAVKRRAFPLGRVARVGEPGALPEPAGPSTEGAEPRRDGEPDGKPSHGRDGTGNEGKKGGERVPDKPQRDAAEPERATLAAAGSSGDDGDGDRAGELHTYGLAGLGALALALGGGFLWYRRRLP
jgi:hypothetical protein